MRKDRVSTQKIVALFIISISLFNNINGQDALRYHNSTNCETQQEVLNTQIIFFSTIYQSNIINFSTPGDVDNFFLIQAKTKEKPEITLSTLSNKSFTSITGILDSLGEYFRVYRINYGINTNDSIIHALKDINNYRKGIVFLYKSIYNNYNSVKGQLMQINTTCKKITYKIVKKEISNQEIDTVVIEKLLE